MSARQETVERVGKERLIPIVRGDTTRNLLSLCDGLAEIGFHILELTFTTPGAMDDLRALRSARPELTVGMGSVLNVEAARKAVDAGAHFIVSPIHDPSLVEVAHAADVAIVAGTFTPTEAQRASADGADLVKVFPASAVGPSYLSALLAPLPHLRLVPTGGVTGENARDFLDAGAFAVCLGSWLVDREALRSGHYDGVLARARTVMDALR